MGDNVILNLSTGREYYPGNVHFVVYFLLCLETEMHGNVVLLMVILLSKSLLLSC